MSKFQYQPNHNFVWVEFVVIVPGVERKYFGDSICKACDYCRMRRAQGYECNVWDESCARDDEFTLEPCGILVY